MNIKKLLRLLSLLSMCVACLNVSAITLRGITDIHDPSTILKDGDRYWTFGTGLGANNSPINAIYSYDLINWQRGSSPIPRNTHPNWINNKVPGFDGNFWAPDIIHMNGKYYLYYSAFSATSGMRSAIGVMVTSSLNNPNWQDLGMVVSTVDEPRSAAGEPVNAIDAGVFRDAGGNVWMVYGSHYAGIYVVQINPATGLRLNSSRSGVVGNNGKWHEYEAAQVQLINGYYYMFVNLGECCAGNRSSYYVVVGRSASPTGPYLDKNGRSLWDYAGSTVLSTSGNYIGPGHFGYLNNNGQDLASIHYYDGTTATGWPGRLDLLEITMVDGWPVFNRNFTLRDTRTSSSSSSMSSRPVAMSSKASVNSSIAASSKSSTASSTISNSEQCNWYGTLHPLCVVTSGGWGFESGKSCIARATCSAQPSPYGIVGAVIKSSAAASSVKSSVASSVGSSAAANNCTYRVNDSWGGGFGASITIKNNRTTAIDGWTVSWTYNDGSKVTNLWNATVAGSNPYTATAMSYNRTIQPGQTVEFGFQGTTAAGITATAAVVTGAVCN